MRHESSALQLLLAHSMEISLKKSAGVTLSSDWPIVSRLAEGDCLTVPAVGSDRGANSEVEEARHSVPIPYFDLRIGISVEAY